MNMFMYKMTPCQYHKVETITICVQLLKAKFTHISVKFKRSKF